MLPPVLKARADGRAVRSRSPAEPALPTELSVLGEVEQPKQPAEPTVPALDAVLPPATSDRAPSAIAAFGSGGRIRWKTSAVSATTRSSKPAGMSSPNASTAGAESPPSMRRRNSSSLR